MSINLAELQAAKSFQYGYQTTLEKFAAQISSMLAKEANLALTLKSLGNSSDEGIQGTLSAVRKAAHRGANVGDVLKNSLTKLSPGIQQSTQRLLYHSSQKGGLQGGVEASKAAKALARKAPTRKAPTRRMAG